MKFVVGSSNQPLAMKIAKKLNSTLIDCEIGKFSNGEKRIWIKDEVNNDDVCLIQSLSQPVDEHIFETLLIVDALERAGAKSINLVIPWMGYSLQDKVFRPGEPIAAKVIADVLSSNRINKVCLLDLHNTSIPGFFSVPTQHLTALDFFIEYVKKNFDLKQSVVVSPDFGGIKKASIFSNKLNLELTNIEKKRDLKTGDVEVTGIKGEVKDKHVLIFDDVINTGKTLIQVADYLKTKKAKSVNFFATHGLFAGNAIEEINTSKVDGVVISNSINQLTKSKKIAQIDISDLFAKAIEKWI
jgi:ribose-phosphate pyrophosphokinase